MSTVIAWHGYVIGFVVIGAWATVCGWATALRLLRTGEAPTFWRTVSVAQVLLALQLLVGLVLTANWLLGNGNAPGAAAAAIDGRSVFHGLFHTFYGVLFPLIVLLVGHGVARRGRYNAFTVFAVVGLVNFGLVTRAWQVGAGVGIASVGSGLAGILSP